VTDEAEPLTILTQSQKGDQTMTETDTETTSETRSPDQPLTRSVRAGWLTESLDGGVPSKSRVQGDSAPRGTRSTPGTRCAQKTTVRRSAEGPC
jgi:hypothetical protein